jgi:hypothetical protein
VEINVRLIELFEDYGQCANFGGLNCLIVGRYYYLHTITVANYVVSKWITLAGVGKERAKLEYSSISADADSISGSRRG